MIERKKGSCNVKTERIERKKQKEIKKELSKGRMKV